MYFVELSQNAQRFLDKLDAHIKQRIEDTLKRLENNPVPSDAKFIERTITKFGNGAKIDAPKDLLGRKVYVILRK